MVSNSLIWKRIENYPLDAPNAALPFSVRLARDNAWTHLKARRAIEEYRRFIYLCAVSTAECTPSDDVDQVWHLHLTYTRDYWGPFTKAVGKEIHHGPTQGGGSEQRRFAASYTTTITLYDREFQEPPPPNIWPSEKQRFKSADAFKRIDISSHIILPKPALSIGLLILALFASFLLGWNWSFDQVQDSFTSGNAPIGKLDAFLSFLLRSISYVIFALIAAGFAIHEFLLPHWYRAFLNERVRRSTKSGLYGVGGGAAGCDGGCGGCGGGCGGAGGV